MDTRDYSSENEQQKQILRFTIEYNKDNPIAVSEFSKALDALNKLYKSYVHQQLFSEELDHTIEEFNENNIGQFYIQEIKSCCLIAFLSDPNTWTYFGRAVDIIGFIGFIDKIYTKIKNWRRSNDTNEENENDSVITNLGPARELIQIVNSPGVTINIGVQGENKSNTNPVEIDFDQKQEIEHNCDRLEDRLNIFSIRKSMSTLRSQWVQIERNLYDGKYYASVINNPIVQNKRCPVDIRNDRLLSVIQGDDSRDMLNKYLYLVDIDFNVPDYRNNNVEYVIYTYYDFLPIDFFIR